MKMTRVDEIMQRAEMLGILVDKRFNHLFDICYANDVFDIDFNAWLESDDDNFTHDFLGIYKNINRENLQKTHVATIEDFNFFVPRFATRQ